MDFDTVICNGKRVHFNVQKDALKMRRNQSSGAKPDKAANRRRWSITDRIVLIILAAIVFGLLRKLFS